MGLIWDVEADLGEARSFRHDVNKSEALHSLTYMLDFLLPYLVKDESLERQLERI